MNFSSLNWKTTVSGLIVALPQIIQLLGISVPVPILNLITALGAVALGYTAKDKDMTGGTRSEKLK